MKYILILLLALCLVTTLQAQQKPPYDRTTTNQVMADRATWSRYHMAIPKGATPGFPPYVPDSLKCGSLFFRTADTCLYIYNCTSSKWDKMQKVAVANKKLDSVAATKANLSGGNVFTGPQTIADGALTFTNASGSTTLSQGVDGATIFTNQRNGLTYMYKDSVIFRIAGPGYTADDAYADFHVPLRIRPYQGGLDYAPSGYNVLVRNNGSLASGDKGFLKEVALTAFATVANTYTRTHVDTLIAANTTQRYLYSATGSEGNSLTNSSLANMYIDGVWRDGLEYRMINSGSPVGNQALVNTSTGQISFQDNLISGEYIKVRYRSLQNSPIFTNGAVNVTTYAALMALGPPTTPTLYKVANDENKSYPNTIYVWWPDGELDWIATTKNN